MSQSEDFLSFEKALRELQLRSEELKRLVSEGEIRAYRDGDSMKFRAEDVASLTSQSEGDTNLSFADSLEDDTGMVTEQISDEDTLLADDDIVEEAPARPARAQRAQRKPRQMAGAAEADETPGWVTGVAVFSTLVLIWAFAVGNSITEEKHPNDSFFTQFFADKAK
ncbi:MAG: hypothetical protein VXY92_05880 [Planctomycetota bacterium]|nr:hypothetical protein [Planctomycetota bacterium]